MHSWSGNELKPLFGTCQISTSQPPLWSGCSDVGIKHGEGSGFSGGTGNGKILSLRAQVVESIFEWIGHWWWCSFGELTLTRLLFRLPKIMKELSTDSSIQEIS